MPCDIGYKAYAKVEIPAPEPQEFTSKATAPEIDADLLEKLGLEDPEFLEWVLRLDVKPLLEEALTRALKKVDAKGLKFKVNEEGMLEAKGSFIDTAARRRLKEISDAVSGRWQFEILGIVAELMDYQVTITECGDEMIMEAEEAGKSHPCDYIKVTRKGDEAQITFEHFKSRGKLDLAMAKFEALANKLRIKITIKKPEVTEGDPFPNQIRQDAAQTNEHHHHGHSHGHSHDHDH